MNKIFAPFLPPWAETGLQPAFYDVESGTVLQQTARMYNKVNQLTRLFNEFSESVTNEVNSFEKNVNDNIDQFEHDVNDNIDQFEHDVNETVADYIERFTNLKDFVEDYFDKLDVQQEINNKLDAMVEDGTLQEIITTYIQSNVAWTFDTVAEMQSSTNLIDGSYARTLGYYNVNDGGGALYKITDSGTADGGSVIAVGDLFAHLVVENNTISARQFGAKINNTDDDSTYIQTAINYIHNNDGRINLTLNSGVYKIDDTVVLYDDVPLVIPNDVTFNAYTTTVALSLYKNSNSTRIMKEWISGEGELTIVAQQERATSGIGVKLEAASGNIHDVTIKNINIRSFQTDFHYEPKNVWNITFANCIFYNAEMGFIYQMSDDTQSTNAGERIAFDTCVFTQNLIDVELNGRTFSQMNFTNCSFDFSNCCFDVPYNSDSHYLAVNNKISLDQCHIEGITQNIPDISQYTGSYGILYMKGGAYDFNLCISNSMFVLHKDVYYFSATQDATKTALLNFNNIYIFSDYEAGHSVHELCNHNIRANAENIRWRVLPASILGSYGVRMDSIPFSYVNLINPHPYFENLSEQSYSFNVNDEIGDYVVTGKGGLSSVVCSANPTFGNKAKKLTINFDPAFSQTWEAHLELTSKNFIPVIPNKPFAFQYIIDYINDLKLAYRIRWYDSTGTQIDSYYDYAYRGSATGENTNVTYSSAGIYAPANAVYCKVTATIYGKASGNDHPRTVSGMMLYYM